MAFQSILHFLHFFQPKCLGILHKKSAKTYKAFQIAAQLIAELLSAYNTPTAPKHSPSAQHW